MQTTGVVANVFRRCDGGAIKRLDRMVAFFSVVSPAQQRRDECAMAAVRRIVQLVHYR